MISKFSLIILVLVSTSVLAQSGVKVLSSDRNSIIIEYTPVYSDTSFREINNQTYLNINFLGGYVPKPENWGEPSIPQFNLNVGVPSEFGNTIEILGTSFVEKSGLISPKPKLIKEGKIQSSDYIFSSDYNNYKTKEDLVSFGDFGYTRDLPVQSFVIHPVKFDVATQNIKLYKTIKFRINFNPAQKISSIPADDFVSGTVLNFNVAKYWVRQKNNNRLNKTIVNSVLASGKWVRFEAPEEGIYKITYSMLSSYGIDPSTVDPELLKFTTMVVNHYLKIRQPHVPLI